MTVRQPQRRVLSLLITSVFLLMIAACDSEGSGTRHAPTTPAASSPVTNESKSSVAPTADVAAKVNLNTASEDDFIAAVPNLGGRMADEFVEYRPYRSIAEFRSEMGKYVKPDQIAEYEKDVSVPIKINEADAATLWQIPGVDEAEATALIAARPYASPDAFLSKLAGYVSEAELSVAKSYVSNP